MKNYKSFISVIFSRVSALIFSYLLMFILMNLISKDAYGEYRFYISVFMLFSLFTMPEMSKVVFKYWDLDSERCEFNLYAYRLISSIAGSIILFVYLLYLDIDYLKILYFVVVFVFFYTLNNIEYIYQAEKKTSELSGILFKKGLIALVAVTIAGYFNLDAIYIAGIFFSASSIVFYTSSPSRFCYAMRFIKIHKISRIPVKKFNREVVLLSLVNILPIIAEHLDKIYLATVLGFSELAVFTVAIMIGYAPATFIKSIVSFYSKHILEWNPERKHYLMITLFLILISIFISACIHFFPVEYFGLEGYEDAFRLSIYVVAFLPANILLFIVYLRCVSGLSSNMKIVYTYNIIGPIIYLIIFLLLVNSVWKSDLLFLLVVLFGSRPLINLALLVGLKRYIGNV